MGKKIKLMYSVEDAMSEYEEARQVALAHESASAMVSATNAKAKLMGLLDDKKSDDVDDTPIEIKIV